MRPLILHYHLFKNAGSSVDVILRHNFPDSWVQAEGGPHDWPSHEVAAFIRSRPDVAALSSHGALLPVPALPGVAVYPVLFVRHPIDRVRSVYLFERAQEHNSEGSRAAKEHDFAGYVLWRLGRERDRVIRDFHIYRLAMGTSPIGNELVRANGVMNLLPFVGIVERFDESVALMAKFLRDAKPDFEGGTARVNLTQDPAESVEERLAIIRDELGVTVYTQLMRANAGDLVLYADAVRLHEARWRALKGAKVD